MRFEHFALNVPDTHALVSWYVEHLGFTIARKREDAPFTHFLADDSGRVILEVYTNPSAAFTNFAAQHPLVFHVALVSADSPADRARLEKVGATFALEDALPDGSRLVMMRDPWGIALQLCQRAKPF